MALPLVGIALWVLVDGGASQDLPPSPPPGHPQACPDELRDRCLATRPSGCEEDQGCNSWDCSAAEDAPLACVHDSCHFCTNSHSCDEGNEQGTTGGNCWRAFKQAGSCCQVLGCTFSDGTHHVQACGFCPNDQPWPCAPPSSPPSPPSSPPSPPPPSPPPGGPPPPSPPSPPPSPPSPPSTPPPSIPPAPPTMLEPWVIPVSIGATVVGLCILRILHQSCRARRMQRLAHARRSGSNVRSAPGDMLDLKLTRHPGTTGGDESL